MKILVLVILLNAQGDIEKSATVGVASNSATCMMAAAKHIDETKKDIPVHLRPFPLCIDIEPLVSQ